MKLLKTSELRRESQKLNETAKVGIQQAHQGLLRTVNVEVHFEALLKVQEKRTLWQRLFRNITVKEVEAEAKLVLAERVRKQRGQANGESHGTGSVDARAEAPKSA